MADVLSPQCFRIHGWEATYLKEAKDVVVLPHATRQKVHAAQESTRSVRCRMCAWADIGLTFRIHTNERAAIPAGTRLERLPPDSFSRRALCVAGAVTKCLALAFLFISSAV